MWNTKCAIIPVITRATGMVTEGLKKNMEAESSKHSVDQYKRLTYAPVTLYP